ncbi:MAG: efflux RND transporter permease subunit [Armatimonadota bacterium]
MWLTKVSIRRPIFLLMFISALLLMGYLAREKMPLQLYPDVEFPFITIITTYPGAGPNEMETLVSEKIEKAVSSIGRLKNITSSSQDSVSAVGLEFKLGTDLDVVAADVRDKIGAIKGDLPKDAEEPVVLKVDISSMPIMTIAVTGPQSPKELRILADNVIQDRLSKVEGVAGVNISGGEEREISVAVDKDRLQAYGLSLAQIVEFIRASNLNVPAGSIKEGARDYSVRTVGDFDTTQQIAELRLPIEGRDGKPDSTIRLSDIAKIEDTVKETTVYTRINGEPNITIDIQKQSGANEVKTADGVKKELEGLKTVLPHGVNLELVYDGSIHVKDSINDVMRSLYEGIFLVVIIIFLFLHTTRATFIVALAIPTSLIATFGPLHLFGFSVNFMTMLGMAVVVGILVDDSIVILENIERHLKMGENPIEAAYNGRTEIGLAAVTITAVDMVVFIPIAFMGGIVGQYFQSFGITVAVATGFSLLMSFTLTPMLASRWLQMHEDKKKQERELIERIQTNDIKRFDRFNYFISKIFSFSERNLDKLNHSYRQTLEWALEHRYFIVIVGIVSLLVVFSIPMPIPQDIKNPESIKQLMPRIIIFILSTLLVVPAIINKGSRRAASIFYTVMTLITFTVFIPFGFEFFPKTDEAMFKVEIRTAPGTSLEETNAVVEQIESVIDSLPEIHGKDAYYLAQVGQASSGGFGAGDTGPQYAVINARVVEKHERERGIKEIVDHLNKEFAKISGAERIVAIIGDGGPGGGISMEIQGRNMDDMLKMARTVADTINAVPGAINVDISWKESKPERRIDVDRIRAAEMNMSVAQIAMAARNAIDGDDSVKLRDEGNEYPINVRFDEKFRSEAGDVENIIIASKNGAPVYLKDVANIEYSFAPSKIDRKNRQRVVYVNAEVATGFSLGNVQNQINAKLKELPKIPGVSIRVGGQSEIMNESFGYMISALILAIILVYMLMGALFESYLTPFVIMLSLPQALVGALLALLITGKTLNIVSMIGMIMLVGLVTKNAILLVDYTNTLRVRGKNRTEAITEAGPTRLRPVIMTTLAMVLGLLPTAIAHTRGAEVRAPMAIAVIGGLILSTLLTLIVIPVVYTIVDDTWMGFLKRFFPRKYQRTIEKGFMALTSESELDKQKPDEDFFKNDL